VVHIVDWLLQYAFDQRASDIHLEPKRDMAVARFRIDGVLHQVYQVPANVLPAMTNRIKLLGRMDVVERRRPQDGRIKTRIAAGAHAGREVELRLSTLPTAFGEKLVLRIFDPEVVVRSYAELGFSAEEEAAWERLIHLPSGIVLVTGPTGSGKTTTLYSTLKQLATDEVNVSTVEDPIENVDPQLNQMQVQHGIDLGFADGLRALMRQDPDVIMVGEIRDKETADMAVQAALTGHLVFSTLHTNTAIGAITRLVDLGIERFLVASTVIGLVAQRLMRLVCPACGESDHVPAETLQLLGLAGDVDQAHVRRGAGCEKCRKTGFFGRTAAFEVIELTDAMRVMIRDNASEQDIAKLARKDGAEPLLSNAGRKLLAGKTTPEEILRVVPATW
jgi:general secretion pathway protein E